MMLHTSQRLEHTFDVIMSNSKIERNVVHTQIKKRATSIDSLRQKQIAHKEIKNTHTLVSSREKID